MFLFLLGIMFNLREMWLNVFVSVNCNIQFEMRQVREEKRDIYDLVYLYNIKGDVNKLQKKKIFLYQIMFHRWYMWIFYF